MGDPKGSSYSPLIGLSFSIYTTKDWHDYVLLKPVILDIWLKFELYLVTVGSLPSLSLLTVYIIFYYLKSVSKVKSKSKNE